MKRLFIVLAVSFTTQISHADIYKYVDANGVVTYTNVVPDQKRKAQLIIAGPKNTPVESSAKPAKSATANASPSGFPKVDQQTQQQRDSKRKDILKTELAQEKQALELTLQQYEDAKNTPEVYRNAKGNTFRNVAKYEDKLRLFEAEIQAHERNIELLNKELNH